MFDNSENYRTDGLGHLSEIVRLVKILDWARDTDRHQLAENIEQLIHEMPLSITVRDGWREVGKPTEDFPAEFEILLGTGGPAVRIYGELNQHGEPNYCQLQNQDWGTPWQAVPIADTPAEVKYQALLDFCRCFYFAD
tara:strand:- start:462 stop:875 length:414 start_codon:yes stop_codon:yes gene_type:complete